MKILILSQYWWPENGVPQRRWTWLSKILTDAGHEVTVIAPPPHYQRKMSVGEWWRKRRSRTTKGRNSRIGPSGERITRSGFFPAGPSLTQRVFNQATVALGVMWAVLCKPGQLKGYKPDLIIGTVPALPTAGVTYLAAKILDAPYVIDLRDAWPDLLNQAGEWNKSTGTVSIRERLLRKGPLQITTVVTRCVTDWTLQHAAAIIVTSSDLEADLRDRGVGARGYGEAPLATIRNVFPPATEYTKNFDGAAEPSQLRVLYAGTLGRAQNLTNVLHAADIAREQGVDIAIRFVGAGVARQSLVETAQHKQLNVEFAPRHEATDLTEFYDWADTGLVHLTDWEPLDRAVPSKTYELMASGIHISGVVSGEAAQLIEEFDAGDVVAPEDPAALAELWVDLANNRERLRVSSIGSEWVTMEREKHAPAILLDVIKRAAQ